MQSSGSIFVDVLSYWFGIYENNYLVAYVEYLPPFKPPPLCGIIVNYQGTKRDGESEMFRIHGWVLTRLN